MKATFVTHLRNIKVTERLYKGVDTGYGIYIANDDKRIKTLLTPWFVEAAGRMEAQALRDSDAYLYAVSDSTSSSSNHIQLLNEYLAKGQGAVTALWLVKDNAVNLDTGFLMVEQASFLPRVDSSRRTAEFSDSAGGKDTRTFTRPELSEAVSLLSQWLSPMPEDDASPDLDLFTNAPRVQRAFYFLQASRAQDRLPHKIAFYCTCLETLFSTDDQELRHQVAERAARFLGTNSTERQHIYQQVKDAYDIRSSVVHGDVLSKKFRKAETIQHYSVVCDEYLRSSIRKILSEPDLAATFSSTKEKLNTFFKEMIFQ